MPTVRIAVQVSAADKAACEDYLSAYGSYPLSVPLTAYPGPADDPATHYGAAITAVIGSGLDTALRDIPGLFAGAAVNVVQDTAPYWKAWNPAVHWTAWLNSLGLQPQVL